MKVTSSDTNVSVAMPGLLDPTCKWLHDTISHHTDIYTQCFFPNHYPDHLDLGGGGGTTWDGTIRKLMLPGLLFHHETPSKDWFYDELKPWVHYIPIDMTLENLHKQFLWAEDNPEEAKMIARQGQEFVKNMRTKEWMDEVYDRYFVRQLGEIVDAYQPSKEGEKENVDTILAEYERSSGGKHHLLTSVCNAKGCTFEDGFRLDSTTFRGFHNDERSFA